MQDHARLILSTGVQSFLASCCDYIDAIAALFSLLTDPDVDYHIKFPLDERHPYVPTGTRELIDDSWHILYQVDGAGNVFVAYMNRRTAPA